MDIASLVLGIVSLIIGFIPVFGAIAFLPALIGLILGIIAIAKKSKENEKKGKGIAGVITCSVAIVIIFFWVFVISAASLDGNNTESSKTTLTSTEVNTTTEKTTSKDKSTKKYAVGEIYEDSSVAIKYASLDDDFKGYNKYANVKSGYKVIKAEFEFENTGSSDFLASSYNFNCYADGYDCEKFYSVDDSSFTSTLSAGKKAKGSVYFQVPQNSKEITLEYETNYWTDSKVRFVVK